MWDLPSATPDRPQRLFQGVPLPLDPEPNSRGPQLFGGYGRQSCGRDRGRACILTRGNVGTAALACPELSRMESRRRAALFCDCHIAVRCRYDGGTMRNKLRFLWNATRGHRLAPWRSPYLLWRIETYTGVKMKQI